MGYPLSSPDSRLRLYARWSPKHFDCGVGHCPADWSSRPFARPSVGPDERPYERMARGRLLSRWPKDCGRDYRRDLHLGRRRDDLGQDNHSHRCMVLPGLFSGRNESGSSRFWEPDLYFDKRRSNLGSPVKLCKVVKMFPLMLIEKTVPALELPPQNAVP
jgi:hypothetical protein